nr:NADH dehydrogenase subunit 5, mitochondrial [Tanacetum cinerariifolium]
MEFLDFLTRPRLRVLWTLRPPATSGSKHLEGNFHREGFNLATGSPTATLLRLHPSRLSSRVRFAAQLKTMKQLCGSSKLELAQLRLLEVDNRVVVPAKSHLRVARPPPPTNYRSFLRFGYEVSFEALDKGAIEILGPYDQIHLLSERKGAQLLEHGKMKSNDFSKSSWTDYYSESSDY